MVESLKSKTGRGKHKVLRGAFPGMSAIAEFLWKWKFSAFQQVVDDIHGSLRRQMGAI